MRGIFSEAGGKLKRVIVCRPSLAHQRLTPSNCRELLFDDVMWVQQAKADHTTFVELMQDRQVEVFDVNDLLEETLSRTHAKNFLLERFASERRLGPIAGPPIRAWLNEISAEKLAQHVIGGLVLDDLPTSLRESKVLNHFFQKFDFIVSPVPNLLFQRDSSAFIGSGVIVNAMQFPARKLEQLIMRTIYKHHPVFRNTSIWFGDRDDTSLDMATLEGGDVLPIGNNCVLIGLSERTSHVGVACLAEALLSNPLTGIQRIIACRAPKARATMHLDTIFTFVDRDCVTAYTDIVDHLECISIRREGDGLLKIHKEKGTLYEVVKDALKLSTCVLLQREEIILKPNGNNGMTETMSSRCLPEKWSLIRGTRTQMIFCATRASRY